MQTPPKSFPAPETALRFDLTHELRNHLPVLQIKGGLTDAGWLQVAEACARLTGPLRVLDFSGVTHCKTTSEDAASFARQLAREKAATPDRPSYVLIAPGDLLFGLCRVIQMNLDMARMKACVSRSVAAATRWLEQENLLPIPPAI